MSPMRLIILAVAAVAAIVAAMMVRNMSTTVGPAQEVVVTKEVEVASAQVLVAVRDLQIGELLTPEDLRWAAWPKASMNVEFYTEELAPDSMETLAGSVVRTPFFENEPILPQKIVQKGATGYMAALLKPGLRAISVEISAESASGGFILPNDRVDVLVTSANPGSFDLDEFEEYGVSAAYTENSLTTTLLENVRVLAIDQIFRQTDTGETAVGRVATLELSPADATLLTQTTRDGRITLALRSLGDAFAAGDEVISNSFLFQDDPDKRAKGEVTIYRSGAPTTAQIGGS